MRACDLGAAALGWLSLKYSLRFRGGSVLLSRSAIKRESLSGDEERSGDSVEERGGVNSRASSIHRTRLDGLLKVNKLATIKSFLSWLNSLVITCLWHISCAKVSVVTAHLGRFVTILS